MVGPRASVASVGPAPPYGNNHGKDHDNDHNKDPGLALPRPPAVLWSGIQEVMEMRSACMIVGGVLTVLLLAVAGCETGEICGNHYCGSGENVSNCPTDCGGAGGTDCGNGSCEAGESASNCASDCDGGGDTWTDPTSGLTWQVTATGGGGAMLWEAGKVYCAGLSLDGGGWHLPTISELRTLIRGCPAAESGGCSGGHGPAAGGCYWPDEMQDECGLHWSSSLVEGKENYSHVYVWGIAFYHGQVMETKAQHNLYHPVLCVRCQSGQCVGEQCEAPCGGKECGDDGCGGSCGGCAGDEFCSNGSCVDDCTPDCAGNECGSDGCGGSCGSCDWDEGCSNGSCVPDCTPDCGGKECGDDGCGGSCGGCSQGTGCQDGNCLPPPLWTDPSSGLTWVSPAPHAHKNWSEAKSYCSALVLGGYSDWHLPKIGELRTLIRGCTETEAGGCCNVEEGDCLGTCKNDCCDGCKWEIGPANGCFWPAEIQGSCDHPYWSSSLTEWGEDNGAWVIDFEYAVVEGNYHHAGIHVRCVR